MSFDINNLRIGIVGLGYVGLPLAVEFGKKYATVGFDIHEGRIAELKGGTDSTLECSSEELAEAEHLSYTSSVDGIADCNFYIVTVPTPIGDGNRPLLTPLRAASNTLSGVLKKGDIVVYESTVYPGATEEFCVPLLEAGSGLTMNTDFYIGYSPERINPGDKEHRLPTILKVTSGSTPEVADYVNDIYASIITAGTHKASSIKVAEAAKVIENTQRDVNIALVNELAMIFERVGIFRPGLVGGHCIGIDPYYLTYKAEQLGYRINDNMALYVSTQVVKLMLKKSIQPKGARVLMLGLTFKENCPDLRNTKVVDIVRELGSYGTEVDVYDPWVDVAEAKDEYGLDLITAPEEGAYDVVIVAVAHDEFRALGAEGIRAFCKETSVLYDIKYILPSDAVDDRL
jgi:UDP-N-acetyl-D-galactosamine dehydrogenase